DIGLGPWLETDFQGELNDARRQPRINRATQAGEEQLMDGYAVMRSVEKVERLGADRNLTLGFESEKFDKRQVHNRNPWRPKGIPSYRAILRQSIWAGVRLQAELVVGFVESEAFRPSVDWANVLGSPQAVGHVAVEVGVATGQESERLARLECADASDMPIAEVFLPREVWQIPDKTAHETVPHVETRAGSFGSAVKAVLRQRGAAGQIEQIRCFVYRVRPGVGCGELNSAREPLVKLRLQAVVGRIGV